MIMRMIRKAGPKKKPIEVLIQRRINRFLSRIDTSGKCRIWRGPRSKVTGAPITLSPWTRQPTTAARIIYTIKCGQINHLDRIKVCCQTAWCLNPEHLELVKAGFIKNEKKHKVSIESLFS